MLEMRQKQANLRLIFRLFDLMRGLPSMDLNRKKGSEISLLMPKRHF